MAKKLQIVGKFPSSETDKFLTKEDKIIIDQRLDALSEEIVDLKGNSIGCGAAAQADWSVNDENDQAYVKNRTHWVERAFDPIVWDGNTDGRDMVDVGLAFGEAPGTMLAYKISDEIFSTETIMSSITSTTIDGETYSGPMRDATDGSMIVSAIPEGFVTVYNYGTFHETEWGAEDFAGGILFAFNQSGDFTSMLGVVIPSIGLYAFMSNPHELVLEGQDTYHTIDRRYFPDVFATEEYVNNAVRQAVGDAIGGSY